MKREVDVLNAVPSKRIYRSIIADYNLETAVAELVDNVLDSQKRNRIRRQTKITLDFDLDDQSITVTDDAGGVAQADLVKLISPGMSYDAGEGGTIGIFGVGSKRAVVALARNIEIASRHGNEAKTYQIEYDDSWLASEDWDLAYYEVDSIAEGSTKIILSRLRFRIEQSDINALRAHLGSTYGYFIAKRRLQILMP